MAKKLAKSSYDYYELCKEWLSQQYDENSTAQNRMHYYKTRLYSFQTLLAEIQDDGVVLIDNYCAKYSNTSKKHTSNLLEALYNEDIQFYVVNDIYDITNIEDSVDIVKEYITKYKRARLDYTRDNWRIQAKGKVAELKDYIAYLASRNLATKEHTKQVTELFELLFKEKML